MPKWRGRDRDRDKRAKGTVMKTVNETERYGRIVGDMDAADTSPETESSASSSGCGLLKARRVGEGGERSSLCVLPEDVFVEIVCRHLDESVDIGRLLIARGAGEHLESLAREWVYRRRDVVWASGTGRLDFVRMFIRHHDQAGWRPEQMEMALGMAAGNGLVTVVRMLSDVVLARYRREMTSSMTVAQRQQGLSENRARMVEMETREMFSAALCRAAAKGHVDAVHYLSSLVVEESVVAQDVASDRRPVLLAQLLQLLRELWRDRDDAALRWASLDGHLHVVRYLLDKGCDASSRQSEALRWAAMHGHFAVVDELCRRGGVEVRANDDEALRLASYGGHYETVARLIDFGASPDSLQSGALLTATHGGHADVVRLLVSRGANPNALQGEAVCWASGHAGLEMVLALLECGANPNARDGLPLRHAAGAGRLDVMEALLREGADIHACDDKALRWACMNGQIGAVQFLIDRDADIQIDGHGALHWACYNGHNEVVKALLFGRRTRHRVDAVHLDRALHWAATNCWADIMDTIIDAAIAFRGDDANDSTSYSHGGSASCSRTELKYVEYAIRVAVVQGFTDVVPRLRKRIGLD